MKPKRTAAKPFTQLYQVNEATKRKSLIYFRAGWLPLEEVTKQLVTHNYTGKFYLHHVKIKHHLTCIEQVYYLIRDSSPQRPPDPPPTLTQRLRSYLTCD